MAPAISRTGVVLTCIGGGLFALWLILLTVVFMMKLGDPQLAPCRTLLILAVITFGALAATAVVSIVIGCWWLDWRLVMRLDALAAEKAIDAAWRREAMGVFVEQAARLAALEDHIEKAVERQSLEGYLADAAAAYEIGLEAGLKQREDGGDDQPDASAT